MIGPVTTTPTKDRWHYARDGQKFGPTDLGGLRQMARCQHLLADSLVWSDGLPAWVPASTIETLDFPAPKQPEASTDKPDADALGQAIPRYPALYRSSNERAFLGVCAGLAHKWSVPVLAVRTAVVLLMPLLMGWAYFLGVFLPAVPTKPEPVPPPPLAPPQPPPPAPPLPAGPNMTSA